MRKIFSILFILVFLFNIIGYFPLFLFRQLQIRNDLDQLLNQQIASGNLLVLSFDKNELKKLKWIKKNEFSYKGDMYDIVMTKIGEDGKTHYYVVLDKKEKQLLVQLEKHVARHIATEGRTHENERNFTKTMNKDFFIYEYRFSIDFNPVLLGYKRIVANYDSYIPMKHTPPPKFV